VQALDSLVKGSIQATPQPDTGVTYAAKLTREDGLIDWTKPATELERQIRALHPWPGSVFMLNHEPIKLLAATIMTEMAGTPGTLLDDHFTVACGEQALRLEQVQRAGKKPADGASFLRGHRLDPGHKL
jgi:methionyl-tRNA formyltransferase